jgi:6-phosphogluconolactonase (cycloisomerase 2 family)
MRSIFVGPAPAAAVVRCGIAGLGLLLALSGCVRGSSLSFGSTSSVAPTYALGGTVAGLGDNAGLVLANGGTTVAVAPRATNFSFPTGLAYGTAYAVTVQAVPTGLTCSVAGGSGIIKTNVANVVVTCSAQAFTVGGTIAVASGSSPGASVAGLVLANGTDTLTVPTGATTFTMPTPAAYGSSYQVTVQTQPSGMSCSVNPATPMTMPASNVTNIAVTCSNVYALGGTVTINGPTGVSLSDQGLAIKNTSNGDTYTFASNASSFTMPIKLPFGAAYALTVTAQPTGLICAIANPAGTMPAAAVNLAVTCSDQAYTLSGTVTINSPTAVTGLSDQGLVLTNSANGNTFTFTSNAATFTLSQPVPYGSPYAISVTTQPTGLNCSVSAPSTTMPAANVTAIAVSCADETFTLGGTIAGLGSASGLVLTNNNADSTTILANATTFNMNTPVPYGADYNVAVAQNPPAVRCTVAQGSNTMPANNVNSVSVACASTPIFAYVANSGTDTVSAYSVDATTGALTQIAGSPFVAGSAPYSVAVNPAGTFAYVSNSGDATVSVYSIDGTTGALTPIAGSPFPTGGFPITVTVNPAGTFAYVANYNDNTVSAYSINATTGTLTPIAGSPFAVGVQPFGVTLNSAGTFAFVPNAQDYTVSVLSVNGTTGALTPVAGSPFAAADAPLSVAVNPAGTLAYVPNAYVDNIMAYSINTTTGALTQIAGSPYPTGGFALAATVNPAGTVLYLLNYLIAGTVSAYSIDAGTGALTPVAGSPYATGTYPFSLTLNRQGTVAYVANRGDGTVSVYSIDATTGALTPLPGSPFAAGVGANSVAISQEQ